MGPHGKSTAAARSLLLREARSLYQDALQDAEERRSLPWRVVLHLAVTVGLAGLRVADVFVSDTGDGRIESKYPPAAALAEAVALLCVGVASFAWSVHRGRQIQFEMSSRIDRAIAQYEESVSPRRGRHGRGPGRGARPGQRRRPRPRFDGHWQHSVRSLLDERLLVPVTSVSVVPTYRDGVWRSIPGNLLVQHDVIALMEGDIAPADAQCLDSDDSDDSVRRGQEVRVREAPAPGAGAAHSAANPGADARDVSTLRLARRMRRFLVLATPLRAHLRHLLDPRQRPRPLMQDHRRRAERVAAMVAAAAALVAVTAVVVRAAARGDMSWGGALLTRLATILLLATGPWYPALYALCEAIGARSRLRPGSREGRGEGRLSGVAPVTRSTDTFTLSSDTPLPPPPCPALPRHRSPARQGGGGYARPPGRALRRVVGIRRRRRASLPGCRRHWRSGKRFSPAARRVGLGAVGRRACGGCGGRGGG